MKSKNRNTHRTGQEDHHPVSQEQLVQFGVTLQHDFTTEQAVIGAALMTAGAFQKVKRYLPKAAFFEEKHRSLYEAMDTLTKRVEKVDLLTVTHELRGLGLLGENGIKKEDNVIEMKPNAAVPQHYLAECSNAVLTDAHLEDHCRILYELYMRREAVRQGFRFMQQAQNLHHNIFDIYDDIAKRTRTINPAKVLRHRTMNDVMESGKNEAPSRRICGNLVKENEVCILFGDAGSGKTILAFQMGNAASKGIPLFPDEPEFVNETKPKLVIYYDFEMQDNELYARYSPTNGVLRFNDNYHRSDLNPDFLDLENADELIMNEIQRDVEIHKPGLIIIDNITYISSESQDPAVATKLMKKLCALQRRYPPLTILVIAHTPKRDLSQPVQSRHLAGAKNLDNFAKSVIAISFSKQDPDKRYIKQTKCRNRSDNYQAYDETHVVDCVISRNDGFLQYDFYGFSNEQTHLTAKDHSEVEAEAIRYAYDERVKNNTSFRDIAKQLKQLYDIDWAHTTISRKLVNYRKEKDLDIAPEDRDKPI
ncbi:MAG: AAA family ATPase [Saprospiraceae bacterium]|jgi:DNA replication protein DnaC|nr:AAA family ATPase [Saprospiraceae bacterium]